jgi:parvulin-like peptidyl-prolyl isomerase
MKYIYYIVFILLGISAIIGYELIGSRNIPGDAAIVINDRTITSTEFEKLYSQKQPHGQSKTDFINSLITKELLIQESRKLSIDKDESFRRSIQNFYEQSLIKLLIDRKISSLKTTDIDDEFIKCINAFNKKFHVTVFSFDTLEQASKGDYEKGEKKIALLDDLSADIRESVIRSEAGKIIGPLKSGDKYLVVRLDKIETDPSCLPSEHDKQDIRAMLSEEKKEKIINEWISDLRKKAIVKIYLKEKNQGETHE